MRAIRKNVLMGMVVAAGVVGSQSGCVVNQYASDPNTRMDQMLNQSEDLRQIGQIWRRFWFNDAPSHMTPERIDGRIM